jgi:tetratricopeptide (TPR) repeat protein
MPDDRWQIKNSKSAIGNRQSSKGDVVKTYKNLMLSVVPVVFVAHSLFVGQMAFGQEGKPSQQPTTTASPSQNKTIIVGEAPPPPKPTPKPISIPESPREKRALAYAKLLEAQRYFYALQRINNPASEARLVISARTALMTATQLEPKLSEAYTLLAELSLLYPSGDPEEATKFCQLSIQANRDNIGAHQLLSRIYTYKSGLKQGLLDQRHAELAIKELREVVRLNPSNAEAWALLSELYKRAGQRKEALESLKNWADAPASLQGEGYFYNHVTGDNLSTDFAFYSLGQALIREGKAAEAIAAISRAIYLNPDGKGYIQLLDDAFDEVESDDSAITEVKRLVATNPSNFNLTRLLARVQSRAGKFDDAVATLNNAITRVSKDDEANQEAFRLALAKTYTDALREKEAIAVYEDILKMKGVGVEFVSDPDFRQTAATALSQIVTLQKNLGQFKEADQTIARMRAVLGKDDDTADEENIELLRNQGMGNEALRLVRTMRQKSPNHLGYIIREAEILSDLDRVDESVALLRSKLSEPNSKPSRQSLLTDIDLHGIISSFYSQAKRGKEAVEASQQAFSIVTQNHLGFIPGVFYSLASAQEEAGDYKGAEDSLRKVLSAKPNDPTALNNLGYFFIERNERLEEAFEMIQRAVRIDPANSSFLDSLGWAYFKLGKLQEAERYLYEAARRSPFSATIQDHLGDVYNKLGKIESARAAWQRALKLTTPKDEQAKLKAKLNGKATGKKI